MRKAIIVLAVVAYLAVGCFVSARQRYSLIIENADQNRDVVSLMQFMTIVSWPPFALVDIVEWIEWKGGAGMMEAREGGENA